MEYKLSIAYPHTHLVHVTLKFIAENDRTKLCFPVWTPGSYKIREYPKFMQDLHAMDEDGKPVELMQTAKHSWVFESEIGRGYVIGYRVYAHELTVRTSHIEDTHALLNGASIFMYPEGMEKKEIRVSFQLLDGWKVYSSLKKNGEHYIASDLDELIDSPFEAGPNHDHAEFMVFNVPHELVIWGGPGNYDMKQITSDLQKIVEENSRVFDGKLPYDRYLFILELSGEGGGGLEHKKSNVSMFPRLGFKPEKQYYRFLGLEAHEHFHVWNVKRIKTSALHPFNYLQEQYVKTLWVHEGFTAYFDDLIPVRAGVTPPTHYLQALGEAIKSFEMKPGRKHQSLEESSFNAWIKLYLPDEQTKNNSISYYEKGSFVALVFDAEIRTQTNGKKSLEDVLRYLWVNYGSKEEPFPEEEILALMEHATGVDLKEAYKKYVLGTDDLPFNKALNVFGLQLQVKTTEKALAFMGIEFKPNSLIVSFVPEGSPAQQAGIYPGDEVIAINSNKVTASKFNEVLKKFKPNEKIMVHVFRRGLLKTIHMTLGEPKPDKYVIIPVEEPSEFQKTQFKSWLKHDYDEVFLSKVKN